MEPIMQNFPMISTVRQEFPRPQISSVSSALEAEFSNAKLPELSHKRIAVAVGSRGITGIVEIVQNTIRILKEKGAAPFLVTAMGSHGGGTADGQAEILADYGLTPESLGVPIRSGIETVVVGTSPEGVPVDVDKLAFESDGIVLLNRVKPHTDFKGSVGSGLMKMIAVGLGNRVGADSFHSWTIKIPYERLIQEKAKVLLGTGKVLFGIAVLENAYHETAGLSIIPSPEVVQKEKELFQEATRLMPSLPVSQADILIIDQIGKDISGVGLDPNITGRWFRLNSIWQEQPDIMRIVLLDLTDGSHGNGCGLGLADFCTKRLVRKMDRNITNINAVTCRNTLASHTPLYFDTDRETLIQAMNSLSESATPENVRLVRILDTLHLDEIEVSSALVPELRDHPAVKTISDSRPMEFDSEGALK
jgi:hypothetical protein